MIFQILVLHDIAAILAVWYVASILMDTDGPFNVLALLRTRLGVYDVDKRRWTAELFNCMYCMAFWVALIVIDVLYLFDALPPQPILRLFAYAGAAVLVDFHIAGRQRNAR